MKEFTTYILLILFVGLIPVLGIAQKNENCNLCKANNHPQESPYHTKFKKEIPFLVVGTGLTLGGYFITEYDGVVPFTPTELQLLDRNDVNAFDRGATYNYNTSAATASDIITLSSAVLPAIFLFNRHTRKDIGTIILISVEVATINYGITSTVKSLVHRTRPYVYNTDLSYGERSDADSRYSFFSGHTSVAASFSFMTAKVLTDYHPNMGKGLKIGIWSFAALLPATTAYLRVESGKHYPTDVMAGYAAGALTGWLVPHLHKKGKNKVSLYPTRLYNVQAVGFNYRF